MIPDQSVRTFLELRDITDLKPATMPDAAVRVELVIDLNRGFRAFHSETYTPGQDSPGSYNPVE